MGLVDGFFFSRLSRRLKGRRTSALQPWKAKHHAGNMQKNDV